MLIYEEILFIEDISEYFCNINLFKCKSYYIDVCAGDILHCNILGK